MKQKRLPKKMTAEMKLVVVNLIAIGVGIAILIWDTWIR